MSAIAQLLASRWKLCSKYYLVLRDHWFLSTNATCSSAKQGTIQSKLVLGTDNGGKIVPTIERPQSTAPVLICGPSRCTWMWDRLQTLAAVECFARIPKTITQHQGYYCVLFSHSHLPSHFRSYLLHSILRILFALFRQICCSAIVYKPKMAQRLYLSDTILWEVWK